MSNIQDKIKLLLPDIRFWIILFFCIRLIGITNPPLEVAHNWRQTTVTMVARNFLETDNNILYPRVDFAGEKTGITGMEFPLLNYMIYLLSLLFGYAHWYGRLINLLVSSFGIFFFYKLILKYFKKEIAFRSTLVLLVSIWFIYSRKIMPDTFSMSFIITAIYFGSNYLEENGRIKDLLLYAILCTIGILSKLPAGYLLVLFTLFVFNAQISLKKKIIFIVVSLFSLICPLLWYLYWVPHLVEKFGFWHFFMGRNFSEGMRNISEDIGLTLFRFYDSALKYIGFGVFMFGLIYAIIKKEKSIVYPFSLCFLSFLLVILKAGLTFSHHSYYIIPFVPVMALVCGYGLEQIKNKKLALILLIAIAVEGILNQQDDFSIHSKDMALLNLETDLDKVSSKKDLIMINSGDYPTPMYFAHRKGWIDNNDRISDENYITDLKQKGLKYIIILKRSFGSAVPLNHQIVFNNDDYCIYKLQ